MTPWTNEPEWQKEREIIQRALFFEPFCKPCELLGWKNNCPGKEKCGNYLYIRLQKHFLEIEELKKTANDAKTRFNILKGERYYGKY